MAQPLEDEFYTVAEAARVLRVSVSTVWRWIDSGKLPAYRVGERRIRIRKQDLGAVVKPFKAGNKARVVETGQTTGLAPLFPTEDEDQRAVLERLQALKQEILAHNSGKLLPSSWIDINEMREERSRDLDP